MSRRAAALALLASLAACATGSSPTGREDADFRARAETRASADVAVTAAALGAAEAEALFGVDLVDLDVQPVWLSIANRGAAPRILFPLGVDPDYYPPFEVARRVAPFSPETTHALYERLAELHMPALLPPGETTEGFVYARADEGLKAFTVELHDHAGTRRFAFVAPAPGVGTDFFDVPPDLLAAPAPELGEADLRAWLDDAPRTTAGPDGASGDPVNIAFVGTLDAVRAALVEAHWDVAAPIDGGALRRMVGAFLFGGGYRYAPVSDLKLFGRRQDLAFQKARSTIAERNHLRLWLAPVRHGGEPVWLGQISRDVGVKFSGRAWPPTTHVIGPDVDSARFYLVQDLWRGERLRKVGLVGGAPVASPAAPALNAEGDPYFSDGRRAVFFVSPAPRGAAPVAFLPWTLLEALARSGRDAPATAPEPRLLAADRRPGRDD